MGIYFYYRSWQYLQKPLHMKNCYACITLESFDQGKNAIQRIKEKYSNFFLTDAQTKEDGKAIFFILKNLRHYFPDRFLGILPTRIDSESLGRFVMDYHDQYSALWIDQVLFKNGKDRFVRPELFEILQGLKAKKKKLFVSCEQDVVKKELKKKTKTPLFEVCSHFVLPFSDEAEQLKKLFLIARDEGKTLVLKGDFSQEKISEYSAYGFESIVHEN